MLGPLGGADGVLVLTPLLRALVTAVISGSELVDDKLSSNTRCLDREERLVASVRSTLLTS